MGLTDARLRALRAKPEPGKHADRDGLHLKITSQGGMYWRWRFRTPTGENAISFGTYPQVSLAEARTRLQEAKRQFRDGINPNEARRAARGALATATKQSFEAVAREWFATRKDEWAPTYASKVIARLEADIFPWLGDEDVSSITSPALLAALRRVEGRGVIETAHRALENCSQVFRFAIATGRATTNPARDLKDALRKPMVQHFPAITDPKRLGELLRACDSYTGTYIVRAALRIMPMVLLRPGEFRQARWNEFDLEGKVWTVPAARMKREKAGKLHGKPHIVPLPTQAVEALKELHRLTGKGEYVFRGERHHDRPMSDATVNAAMRALGFGQDEVTAHGFRATARTILAERLGFPESVIEAQLAHSVKDSLGRAYNRTEFLDQRREMLQQWADYLDKLREGSESPQSHFERDRASNKTSTAATMVA